MKYTVRYDNPDQPLMDRLLQIRNIGCQVEDFFDPTLSHYRQDPFALRDMDIAVARIYQAIQDRERIMIFGDYDVDGISSSYILYHFVRQHLGYDGISIMFPHRRHDGYGIKRKHIEQMKEKNIGLIITVDNGITSIDEALYASELGIEMIITDHHEDLDTLPQALAIVNPHISPDYEFAGLCGATVAFKVVNALMDRQSWTKKKKASIFEYYLPIVSLATVADCVPLVHENRPLVSKGLNLINRGQMPASLASFIDYLGIKGPLNTFHFGFQLGPRINAGGRISTPYDSLKILLTSGEQQRVHLDHLESLNTERRKMQEKALTDAKKDLDLDQRIIIAASPEFHEGIVGIVAGRLTEEHYRPSVILSINEDKGQAMGSLRAPPYFSIIDMLQHPTIAPLLERFGGHQQAGGLTVTLEHLDALITALQQYCLEHISDDMLERNILVDTVLHEHDITHNHLRDIQKFAPFGIGNEEPLFVLENVDIIQREKVGRRGQGHVKLHVQHGQHKLQTMFRSKGNSIEDFTIGQGHIIGHIQPDNYNGGRQLIGKYHIPRE